MQGYDDFPYRAAATLAINLMNEKTGLEESPAIDAARNAFKEIEIIGPSAKFQSEHYREGVRVAIHEIQTGRRRRVEYGPSIKRRAHAQLGLAAVDALIPPSRRRILARPHNA